MALTRMSHTPAHREVTVLEAVVIVGWLSHLKVAILLVHHCLYEYARQSRAMMRAKLLHHEVETSRA